MDEETTTPASGTTPAESTPPEQTQSTAEADEAKELEAQFGQFLRDDAEQPDADPEQKPEPKAEPEEVKPEPESEDKKLELQLARAHRDIKRLTTEALDIKKRAETAEQRYAAVERNSKQNPIKAMEELSGMPFHELMQRAARGEYDDAKLPDDVREAVEYAKQAKAEKAERDRAASFAQAKQRDLPRVQEFLDGRTDLPLVMSMPNAAQALLDIAYDEIEAGKAAADVDLDAIAKGVERDATEMFREYFGNSKLLAAVMAQNEDVLQQSAKDPSIKALLTKVLGLPPQPNPGSTSSKSPVAPKPIAAPEVHSRIERQKSDEEERAELINGFTAFKQRNP